ncbi:hypothetical protein REPUB_Repub09cG0059100 [Reevesia pubescens]
METNNQEQASELFTLAIYGLMVFLKILRHVEGSVVDFCGQVKKSINPTSFILVETIRTLNFYRSKGKGCLIGCTQLIYVWLQSHFWGEAKVLRCPYSSLCKPVKEFLKVDWPKGITKNEWNKTFKRIIPENVTWKALWMPVSAFVYKCGENPWVPLISL